EAPTTMGLETQRLILESPARNDAARLLAYVTANREAFARWEELRPAEYFTLAHWEAQIGLMERRILDGQEIRWLLCDRDDPGGTLRRQFALTNIVRGPFQAAFVGYSLDQRSWSAGLMHEALERVIRYAFDEVRLHRIMANYMPANERSGRLLRRLGFAVEG